MSFLVMMLLKRAVTDSLRKELLRQEEKQQNALLTAAGLIAVELL